MSRVLLIRNLQEESHGLVRNVQRVNVGGAGQCAEAFVVEHRQLIECDGHVGCQCRIRRGKHLPGKTHGLGQLGSAHEVLLQHPELLLGVGNGLVDVVEAELILGHTELRILTVLQHGKGHGHDDGTGTLLPNGVLLGLDRADNGNQVVQILVNLIVDLLALQLDLSKESRAVRIGLAFELVPLIAVFVCGIHHLQSAGLYLVVALINLVAGMQKQLVAVVQIAQRVPPEGAVGITEIQHHGLVALAGEISAVHLEKLTLRVSTDHGGAGRRGTQNLDHRVNEGGRLTGTGGTDDDGVHGGRDIDVQLPPLIVVYRIHGDTVLLLRSELGELLMREVEIHLLLRHEAGILQCGIHGVLCGAPHEALGLLEGQTMVHEIEGRNEGHDDEAGDPGLGLDQQHRIQRGDDAVVLNFRDTFCGYTKNITEYQ